MTARRGSHAIMPFSGTNFDLSVHQDIEPMKLLDKIEDALLASDWNEQQDKAPVSKFNRGNRSPVAVRTTVGIRILHCVCSEERYAKAAAALISALRNAKLQVTDITVNPGGESDRNVI